MKVISFLLCVFAVTSAYAETSSTGEAFSLSEIVVTPNRYVQNEADATSDVTVISQADIAGSDAKTISDVLQGQLGVKVYDNSSAKTATVDIRGYGEFANRSVLVLVNDRKVNPLDTSGPDWLQIPLETVERIEVIRGAGSVLYGDNAVGGVINIITKKGQNGIHGETGITYGSYDTQKEYVQLAGKKGAWDFLVHAEQFETDGYRTNSQLRAKDFDGRIGYEMNDAIRFDVLTSWHEDKYGLPAAISGANIEAKGRRGTTTPEDFAETKDRMVQLSADIDPWKGADIGKFKFDVSYRNRDTYGAFYSFFDDAKSNIDTWGVTGKYLLERQINGHEFKLNAGVDYYTNDDSVRFVNFGFNQDEFVVSKDEFGVYAALEYEVVDKVFLSGGSRYNKDYYTFNHTSTPEYNLQNPDAQVNMGGVRYQYAPNSNIFADVQQTFRFLSTDEWYNFFGGLDTTLKQQKGVQYEAGIKHDFENGYKANFTVYDIENKNEISFDPTLAPPFGASINYDRTRRTGIEFGQEVDLKHIFTIQPLYSLNAFANYTYEDAEFAKGNFKGKRIPLTAEQLFTAGIDVGLIESLTWRFSGRYTGDQYSINDEGNLTDPMEAYTLFDTKLTWAKKNWEVFGALNNIFGQRYFIYSTKSAAATNKSYYPAPERSFTVGMKLKF